MPPETKHSLFPRSKQLAIAAAAPKKTEEIVENSKIEIEEVKAKTEEIEDE